MKPSILLSLLATLIICNSLLAQNDLEREMKTTIKGVTVFTQGALISRSGNVEIPKGKSTIRIASLSPHMDEKSIQVQAEGNFTIVSVNHSFNHLEALAKDAKVDSLLHEIELLEFRLATNESRLQVLQEKQSLLDQNKNLGGQTSGASLSELKQAIAFYDQELSEIKQEEIQTRIEIKELTLEKGKLEQEVARVQQNDALPVGEIEIRVDAEASASGSFEISYLVGNAGWYPKYDVRVKSVDKPLTLVYKAAVYQNTGNDWDNVKLKFSNANPNQSGVAPELDTWYLNYARNTIVNRKTYGMVSSGVRTVSGIIMDQDGLPLPGANIVIKGTSVGTQTDFDGHYSLTLPNGASHLVVSYLGYRSEELAISSANVNVQLQEDAQALDEVVVTGYSGMRSASPLGYSIPRKAETITTTTIENQTTFEFEVATPYSIKSDGVSLSVDLKNFEVPTHYEYYAVPKLDKDAFLMARIVDWNKYHLLEGEANLYFEGAYVGRSILDARSLSDTLNISLGRDKSIVIGREKVDSYTRRRSIGSNKVETLGFKILARNKKSQGIKLNLFDQLPVAAINDISVSAEELSGGILNEKTGEIKWTITLPAGEQKDLTLSYEVKYPKRELVNLE